VCFAELLRKLSGSRFAELSREVPQNALFLLKEIHQISTNLGISILRTIVMRLNATNGNKYY
jgi:hypothetical protein